MGAASRNVNYGTSRKSVSIVRRTAYSNGDLSLKIGLTTEFWLIYPPFWHFLLPACVSKPLCPLSKNGCWHCGPFKNMAQLDRKPLPSCQWYRKLRNEPPYVVGQLPILWIAVCQRGCMFQVGVTDALLAFLDVLLRFLSFRRPRPPSHLGGVRLLELSYPRFDTSPLSLVNRIAARSLGLATGLTWSGFGFHA